MCVCVSFHASLGVPQLKPAVYHSSLPCVTSKSQLAQFRLFMTQSQEGHTCLCWPLWNKTWTYIKLLLTFLLSPCSSFKDTMWVSFLTDLWFWVEGKKPSLPLNSTGINARSVSFTQLQKWNNHDLIMTSLQRISQRISSVLPQTFGSRITTDHWGKTNEKRIYFSIKKNSNSVPTGPWVKKYIWWRASILLDRHLRGWAHYYLIFFDYMFFILLQIWSHV